MDRRERARGPGWPVPRSPPRHTSTSGLMSPTSRVSQGQTRGDLARGGLLVHPAGSLGSPLEMLHHVRHINPRSIDPRFIQRLVQKISCRADEGASLEVFLVSRLLADEHHGRRWLALAEDSLRSGFPEITGLTSGGGDL